MVISRIDSHHRRSYIHSRSLISCMRFSIIRARGGGGGCMGGCMGIGIGIGGTLILGGLIRGGGGGRDDLSRWISRMRLRRALRISSESSTSSSISSCFVEVRLGFRQENEASGGTGEFVPMSGKRRCSSSFLFLRTHSPSDQWLLSRPISS